MPDRTTRSVLKTKINADLASASSITAAEHRGVETDIVDSASLRSETGDSEVVRTLTADIRPAGTVTWNTSGNTARARWEPNDPSGFTAVADFDSSYDWWDDLSGVEDTTERYLLIRTVGEIDLRRQRVAVWDGSKVVTVYPVQGSQFLFSDSTYRYYALGTPDRLFKFARGARRLVLQERQETGPNTEIDGGAIADLPLSGIKPPAAATAGQVLTVRGGAVAAESPVLPEDWAQDGNTDAIPASKLVHAGTAPAASAYHWRAQHRLSPTTITSDTSVPTSGAGVIITLLGESQFDGGIKAGEDFKTEWEGLVFLQFSADAVVRSSLRTRHRFGGSPEITFTHVRHLYHFAQTNLDLSIPMVAFNSRSAVNVGLYSPPGGGDPINITQEHLDSPSYVRYELAIATFSPTDPTARIQRTLKRATFSSLETTSFQLRQARQATGAGYLYLLNGMGGRLQRASAADLWGGSDSARATTDIEEIAFSGPNPFARWGQQTTDSHLVADADRPSDQDDVQVSYVRRDYDIIRIGPGIWNIFMDMTLDGGAAYKEIAMMRVRAGTDDNVVSSSTGFVAGQRTQYHFELRHVAVPAGSQEYFYWRQRVDQFRSGQGAQQANQILAQGLGTLAIERID